MATERSFSGFLAVRRAPGRRSEQLDEAGEVPLATAKLVFGQPPAALPAVHQLVERDPEDLAQQRQLLEPRRVLPPLPVAHPLPPDPPTPGEGPPGPPPPLPLADDPAAYRLNEVSRTDRPFSF